MSALRHVTRDEDGSVLIAVVGIMVVLTVLAIGAFAMADDNLFQAKHDRARAQAIAVAEAGMEQALWLRKANAPTETVYTYSVDIPNMGRATIEASATGATTFHIIATGAASQTPQITRTISADILSMSIWDMFYANGPINPGSNGKINGSGRFYGSAYMRGNWPPTNGNAAFEQGPFFVKDGNVDFTQPGFGNATMGSEGRVDLYSNGSVNMTGINANLFPNVPDLPMPQQTGPELAVSRSMAIAESTDESDERRTTGESTGVPSPLRQPYADRAYGTSPARYYKVIDDDSVVNTSVATFYLGKSATGTVLPSFGRPYDTVLGRSPDDFAWDAVRGVLTVEGTVFIDAQELYLTDIKWAGKGTLVVSGNVHVNGMWEPASFSVPPVSSEDPGDENGYPKKNVVGVSASGAIYENSPEGYGVFFSSILWTMDTSGSGSNQKFFGEIVAPEITMAHNAEVHTTPGMGQNVPSSMPGGAAGGQIIAITGWHEGRN